MNLETLKKYWNELEHYKNGGSLLARIWITDDNDGDESYTIWYKVGCECWDINKVYNYTLDYHKVQIIINDEYSIYRKALAEGKIIQCNIIVGQSEQHWYAFKDKQWYDTTEFQYSIDKYRIKPEEPKFKAGDFIRQTKELGINVSRIYRIKAHISDILYSVEKNIYDVDAINAKEEYFELWKPSHKELCYFTHYTKTKTSATLREFREISKDGFYVDCFGTRFIYCEPFLNSKPSWFKD